MSRTLSGSSSYGSLRSTVVRPTRLVFTPTSIAAPSEADINRSPLTNSDPGTGYNDNTSATYHIRTHLQQLENTISSLAQEVSNIGKEISSIKAIATTAKANTEYLTSEDYQYTIAEKVKEWNRCDRILDIAKEVKEDVDVNAEEAGLEQKRLEGLAESVKISLASVSTKVEYIKSTQYRRWMSELTAQYVREDMKDTVTALMKEVQEVMEEAKKNMKTDQETRLDQMIASISAEVKDIQSIHYQRNISAFTAEYVREDMEETVKTLRKEVQEAMKEAKKEMKTVEEVRLNQIDKGEDDWERFLRVNIEPLIWAPLRRRWSLAFDTMSTLWGSIVFWGLIFLIFQFTVLFMKLAVNVLFWIMW